jgi:Glycine rich protein/Divergent InlB B-repeat domain
MKLSTFGGRRTRRVAHARRILGVPLGIVGVGFAVCLALAPEAEAATSTFGFTGGEQVFVVPGGVTRLQLVAVGAPGGKGFDDTPGIGGLGGFGSRVSGALAVMPGQRLFIEVGGTGASGAAGGAGGFNGGGSGGSGDCAGFGSCPAGGGGGATDLRTCSVGAGVCSTAPSSLNSRLVVAGGGGGGGTGNGTPYTGGAGGDGAADGHQGQPTSGVCVGGAGGKAGTSTDGGGGGAQTTCSSSVDGNAGSFGQGASNGNQVFPGGGGGGGLYGGGGGGGGNGSAAGGGGSNLLGTLTKGSVGTDSTGVPSVTLTYTLVYPLTVSKSGSGAGTVISSPTGISCGSRCRHTFRTGTVVTLTAQAAHGSRFASWSGACTGTGTCRVTMTAARKLTATFEKIVPPPNTTVTGVNVRGAKHKATFDFNGSGGVGALRFQCKLDSGSWKSCSSPKTYAGLAPRSHTFRVRAIDARGKADPAPAKVSFTI